MRVVLQRVKSASVTVDDQVIGKVGKGYMLLVGFTHDDSIEDIDYIARKVANARLFADENGKINLSIKQVQGAILSVSQFTLYASTKNGNRPGFGAAQKPELAKENYHYFNEKLRSYGIEVQTGQFGADMDVALVNDGPITIIYDSNQK
ncbi:MULTISPECIES: D-aminoacyl-tRNA deacylase [Ligilactobacillus]|uniref:D-aminoacyl-tRNA deacylase n=1 Tax=Ligilactobacillus aviarius TaxID=1606 RepID=A0A2A7PYJ4_9LACO|nr:MULTISPECIES: D-aminoacyl-tRNA deacylase [Ligilactobacillus]HJD08533.1 D-tyrosyl-tRNA(Tyr) deacylase [Candidatus Ligilactobacillus faecavium]KRM38949.1 D-tyrosyl-tRNA(Tyr) deacylase [Ligilactobacillus aviarius subsp. aviarius DSM 20655]MBM6862260.1 D-tyrosyl-tRNA(Tyr) deacylase [Ligilactobacillus aviarius]MDO3392654.1 D-aminoacyl-tRNA deacylase [Ligilactobacillus sp. 110_WCHN]OAQ02353.1 D-tyrosyl-tRNA(Tyr) deacylase [Ligilactobacillus aviarius]